jgi:hypothetical protein
MRKLIFLLVLFSASRVAAQSKYGTSKIYINNRNTIDEFREDKERNGGFIANKNLVYKEIEGSPYLNEHFSKGVITLLDGTVLDSCLLRYNIFTDQMEYENEGTVYEVAPKLKVKRAQFDHHLFSYLRYKEKDKQEERYFEVLAEGKVSLYKKRVVKFVPPAPSSAYNEAKQAFFELPQISYYVAKNGGETFLVRNKKALLKVFKSDKESMTTYISENGLSILKEGDLIKIVNQYNAY